VVYIVTQDLSKGSSGQYLEEEKNRKLCFELRSLFFDFRCDIGVQVIPIVVMTLERPSTRCPSALWVFEFVLAVNRTCILSDKCVYANKISYIKE